MLNYFDLAIANKITNLKDVLPIFNDNCLKTFYNLKFFYFSNPNEIDNSIMKNIYNNIHCMPNLCNFKFNVVTKIDEDFYISFIHKILLSLKKLSVLSVSINKNNDENKNFYSLRELQKQFEDIDFKKYSSLSITKLVKQKSYYLFKILKC